MFLLSLLLFLEWVYLRLAPAQTPCDVTVSSLDNSKVV